MTMTTTNAIPAAPSETFLALRAHRALCAHAFLLRVPGVDVGTEDRAAALARLDASHRQARRTLGLDAGAFIAAQQVHGREVACVAAGPVNGPIPGVDGLVSDQPGLTLGIYVADCCAVFLLDPVRRAIGLVHSGKKGTELGIVPGAIAEMGRQFGSCPADLVVQLSPCIRPPFYEIDFAADLRASCLETGVLPANVHDSGANTAEQPDRYYSYRMEKGRTGRMLALLALTVPGEVAHPDAERAARYPFISSHA